MAPTNKINIPNETLEQFVERYRVLSHPQFVNNIMRRVTYYGSINRKIVDRQLKYRMDTLSDHPKDTGLMKRSWVLPEQYIKTHFGKTWQVYVLNTATVGEQARLKEAQKGGFIHKKKKRTGRHNLKRYMPWVDKRTKFYTKQLRVIRNKIKPIFHEQIIKCLILLREEMPGVLNPQELANLRTDTMKFSRG